MNATAYKPSQAVTVLSVLIVVLALVAAGVGLFWQDGGKSYTFTSLRGVETPIYGQGLYRYDTLLIGAGFRGNDATTLFVALPLLVVSLMLYRRGSLRGGLLLAGALAYFLYGYASMAFGAAYNELFLLYIVLFSASLFAFVTLCTSFDMAALAQNAGRLARRGPAAFLFTAGVVLIIAWLFLTLLPAMLAGKAPDVMGIYTTLITHVLDLGLITPATFLAGVLILRRHPAGYLLGAAIITLGWQIGIGITAATVAQLQAGVVLTPGDMMAFVIPFVVLTVGGLWADIVLLRGIKADPAPAARAVAGKPSRA